MSNIVGLCLDDIIEEIEAYTSEGVSRTEAIEYVAYKQCISSEELSVRIRAIKSILSVQSHIDLGHLLDLETSDKRNRYTGS